MSCIWVFSEDAQQCQRLTGLASMLVNGPSDRIEAVILDESAADSLHPLGISTVFVIKGAGVWPEACAATFAKLASEMKPDLILVAATPRGKDIAATVAAQAGTGLVSEAFAVRCTESGFETERLMYGGLAVCTEALDGMTLVTVQAGNYEVPASVAGRSAKIVVVDGVAVFPLNVGDPCPVPRSGADIAAADWVVGVGRGMAKKEDLVLAEDLATALGGAVGCTRSIAEDYGWMPEETYIGLSGQKIRPKLYIALGISGQVQHVAGIRDSKIIVGVDCNENAPIFASTDYGIVGDLYEIAPLLTQALKARLG